MRTKDVSRYPCLSPVVKGIPTGNSADRKPSSGGTLSDSSVLPPAVATRRFSTARGDTAGLITRPIPRVVRGFPTGISEGDSRRSKATGWRNFVGLTLPSARRRDAPVHHSPRCNRGTDVTPTPRSNGTPHRGARPPWMRRPVGAQKSGGFSCTLPNVTIRSIHHRATAGGVLGGPSPVIALSGARWSGDGS